MITDDIDTKEHSTFLNIGRDKNVRVQASNKGSRIPFPTDVSYDINTNYLKLYGKTVSIIPLYDINKIYPLTAGKHHIDNGYIIAIESYKQGRIYIIAESDVDVMVALPVIEVITDNFDDKPVTIGIRNNNQDILYTSNNIPEIFNCMSRICSSSSESSPNKSHAFFRDKPSKIMIHDGDCGDNETHNDSDIVICLPPDLRYLYTASPIAYYLGAGIEVCNVPGITFSDGSSVTLPEFPAFGRYIADMFERMFNFDCKVRYSMSPERCLQDKDIYRTFGFHARDIFYMDMKDRFLLYSRASISGLQRSQWHMASYIDPVPGNVRVIPYLLDRLSAIYMPESTPISENETILLSIRNFQYIRKGNTRSTGAIGKPSARVVLPVLGRAQCHYWFSDGFPVDAVKASLTALENRYRFSDERRSVANIAVICNERSMEDETVKIHDILKDASASIEIYSDMSVKQFTKIFSAGYDMVQFIGHCNSKGFKCADGFAKASDIQENNTPMFFFNSCSSHTEAIKLIDKGSVCGIATLFKVLEESAFDISKNVYTMLRAGYPALSALEAAKECSIEGKEYLLIGDGSYTCFNTGEFAKPFYKIIKNRDLFSLYCTVSNRDKGFIIGSGNDKNDISDMGFEAHGLSISNLKELGKELIGYCVFNGVIYSSVRDVVQEAERLLIDDNNRKTRLRDKFEPLYSIIIAVSTYIWFIPSC